jgi:hypothetical protein
VALVASIALIGAAVLGTRSSGHVPPAAATPAAERNAPASLVAAANAVGFSPQTEAGVGQIEGQPASAAEPPRNQHFSRSVPKRLRLR